MVMKICPHINTVQWKLMVKHLDGNEREAYRAYMAHGYTLPNAIPTAELKKIIGMSGGRYSVTQQIKMNQKIRKWNEENGTSHRIKYTPYGSGEMSTAVLELNYLPVNKEKQADRDRRRKMQGYIGLEEGESFDQIYTPSESEQEAGQFNEEGDFMPPSYSPMSVRGKKGPKFAALIESKQADLKILYDNRAKLSLAKRNTSDADKRQSYRDKLAKVNAKINSVEESIVVLENSNKLSEIEKYAEEDMKTLERIFTKENPSFEDLNIARRIINLWKRAGTFESTEPHIFFTPAEFAARDEGFKEIADKFTEWRRQAELHDDDLVYLENSVIENALKKTFGEHVSFDSSEPLKEIGFLAKNVLDISEIDNILLNGIATWVKKANFAAKLELDGIFKELDDLIDKANLKDYDIFQQTFSNEDNRKTGELVFRFTQEFFEWEGKVREQRERVERSLFGKKASKGKIDMLEKANRKFVEEFKKETDFFDVRIFDKEYKGYSEEKEAQERERLIGVLGEKGYETYYELNMKKLESYKADLISQERMLEGEYGTVKEGIGKIKLDAWVARNSPYLYAEVMTTNNGFDKVRHEGLRVYPTLSYMRVIPKKGSKFYDKKFARIEANDDYFNLYNYMFDLLQTLKLYLPNEKVGFMQVNSIPTLAKKLGEVYSEGGFAEAFRHVRDSSKEAIRVENVSEITKDEDEKEFQFHMLSNNNKRIRDYIELKDTEYRAQNDGVSPDEDMRQEWRREIIDNIASEKSFDLGLVMKAFASTAVTYKHRASIEDQMRIARDIIRRGVSQKENEAGQPSTDKYGNVRWGKNIENLKKMLEDFMDVAYWGYSSNIPEGISKKPKKKVLTSKEEEAKAILEKSKQELQELLDKEQISPETYRIRLDVIEDQLQALGGVKAASKYGDVLLKYIQLKGMGWNIFAAFANMGFGFISNVIEASDGRNYSYNNFWKAQMLTMNSVFRNFTFNSWDGLSGNAKKIRVLMDKFDTLKEAKNEIYQSSKVRLFRRIGEKLEWMNPYSPQTRSEYFNQAPVMIALMMDEMVTTADGTEMSLWDAYNADGTLKESITFTEDAMFDLKIRIDKLVKMNHGNYDPDTPLAAKRKFMGRALSQFRTWAFQGFAERFVAGRQDEQLGIYRKGRYRSYAAYFMDTDNSVIQQSFNMVFTLLKKLIGFHTNFDSMVNGQFTEADAANMRKNMTEIVLYMAITSLTLLLKASIDDDDDPRKKFAYYFLINQMGRLGTDIMFYTNPIEFERLARNAIPAFSLVVDAAKLVDDVGRIIKGEEDILQSGPNKGMSRTLRDLYKVVPGPAQYQKIISAGEQIYNK
jgi:hypothetical protein